MTRKRENFKAAGISSRDKMEVANGLAAACPNELTWNGHTWEKLQGLEDC